MAASATEQTRLSLRAAADLSGFQYCAVRVSGSFGANLASNATALTAIGILQNDPTSGHGAVVCVFGESKARAGGTITAGAPVTHDGSGCVIAQVSGSCVLGYAMESAVVLDIIDILVGGPSVGAL